MSVLRQRPDLLEVAAQDFQAMLGRDDELVAAVVIHVGGHQGENLASRLASMRDIAAGGVINRDPVPGTRMGHAQTHLTFLRAVEIPNANPAAPAVLPRFLGFLALAPEASSIPAVECFQHVLEHDRAGGRWVRVTTSAQLSPSRSPTTTTERAETW